MAQSSDLAALEAELNRMIVDGESLAAFERFYAEDVVMQENSDPPVIGKAANRRREQELLGNLAGLEAELLGSAVGAGVTFSEWIYTFTSRDGRRQRLCEVSVRRWRGGEVIGERFYYERT
ncbi:MAG: nuclear transport factor 2 family protein [Myxococcales bacterium]|nr:nuclear transport factor 2 family protein [Myxococcales bacterium]MCB9706646.1 nuclear transport factor 2 family protein [Myxococcales bacterium]